MSEQLPKKEVSRAGGEHLAQHEIAQHHERIERHHEKSAHHAEAQKDSQETLRSAVESQAISGAEYHTPQAEQRQHITPVTRADKERVFNTVMHQVQNDMSKSERKFSQFIHHPTVEKTSELVGKTVARPSGLIGATTAAAIGLLSVYGIAKFAGFGLSGSEVPLLLGAGFFAGLFIEWCWKSLRSIIGRRTTKNSL